jgi:hypothetical protein
MTDVIIYTNDMGGVSVISPCECGLTIEEIAKKDTPKNVPYSIIDAADLPPDNDFFDAWEQTNGVISVNFSKAQEITKARLRLEREPLLAAQDVAFQRALEVGADTSGIVAEKQRLRDVTKLADDAKTLAELRVLEAK